MFIKTITLNNFLSFGENSKPIELGRLNVLIGPNGSGKSNLLEALELLKSTPTDLLTPIRDGGGIRDWLWKGGDEHTQPVAKIEAVLADIPNHPTDERDLRYTLQFTEVSQRFEIVDERIERAKADGKNKRPYFFYKLENGKGVLNIQDKRRNLRTEDIDFTASIISQRKDPLHYPEITQMGKAFHAIRLYRDWSFGRYTPPRLPQKADMPNDYLASDCKNLGLVLNEITGTPSAKRKLLSALQDLYESVDDYFVKIEGGTVQVFFVEGDYTIPATRLSDGTLRYLCLLAILCHPGAPSLICIEEPELGLHPDVLPTIAQLLKDASEKSQIIVTTHSDVLVDAMSEQPEAVLITEKTEQGTQLSRLDAEKLRPWLEKYRLGELWTRGDLGGTRW